MTYHLGVIILMCASLGLPAQEVLAKDPPAQGRTQREEASKTNSLRAFAQEPFDLNVTTLPPNYRGHSCNEFAKKLKTIRLGKGEFETTGQYQRRIESAASLPLYGSVTVGDTLAFAAGTSMYQKRYDADSKLMQIDASLKLGRSMITDPVHRGFFYAPVIDIRDTRQTRSLASNAFGAKAIVTTITSDVCGLIFANESSPSSMSWAKVSFAMEPEEARASKDNLSVLYVGTLATPFYSSYFNGYLATFDSPTTLVWQGDGLVMDLLGVWIFDRLSGKVYAGTPSRAALIKKCTSDAEQAGTNWSAAVAECVQKQDSK